MTRPVSTGAIPRDELPFDCDLVLKGGITSGIVYPPAIAEIAVDHRLRSVGGASAGAIAAAAAAAAEYGREKLDAGFALLEKLPTELKEDRRGQTQLQRLFSPPQVTEHLFDACWTALRGHGTWGRLWKVGRALARHALPRTGWGAPVRWVPTVVWLVLAVVAVWWAWGNDGPRWLVALPVVLVAAVVLWLARTVLLAIRGAKQLPEAIEQNGFGLVSGLSPQAGAAGGLSTWLHVTLQRLAGRSEGAPLTYGDLAKVDVRLVTVTTNLTFGTGVNFPFRAGAWAFHPDELARVLPQDVVEHMTAKNPRPPQPPPLPGPGSDAKAHKAYSRAKAAYDKAQVAYDTRLAQATKLGLSLLPDPHDLPIVLGARISLSFPVLLSAVPLYTWTAQRDVGGTFPTSWVKCWFSDGGITSNLPVFLFDTPLPSWPTYAINLVDGGDRTKPPLDNIYRPTTTGGGLLPSAGNIADVGGFLGGVLGAMQNWTDNALTRAVGQRDRICRVRLADDEGGMNLEMGAPIIESLVERGKAVGNNLASMQRDNHTSHQWDRHRFGRFRAFLAGTGEYVGKARPLWTGDVSIGPGVRSYRDLSEAATHDNSGLPYSWGWSGARHQRVWQSLAAIEPAALQDFVATPPAGVRLGTSVFDTATDYSGTGDVDQA